MNRLVVAFVLLAVMSCSQGDNAAPATARRGMSAVEPVLAFGHVTRGTSAGTAYEARIRQQRTFANLPDRGELFSYDTGTRNQGAVVDGAYTWHKVGVSEEHALRAIATGYLRVLTPSGKMLDVRYDRHVEHPSGDLSWIGHVDGMSGAQTIITFGASAVYGSIGQPGKRSLRLTTREGASWVIETDPSKLAGLASAGANPRYTDALAAPKIPAESDSEFRVPVQALPGAATAAATSTIDLLIGYSKGFASTQGSTSSVMTRLNYLVMVSNQALANSNVNTRIRLVHAMQVSYGDTTNNESALEQLTGFDTDSQQTITPHPAFDALRAARETYGADLVTLVRQFRDPEQRGCGIAWLLGGGRSGVSPGDGQEAFGFSVVSDGVDLNEQDQNTYFCRDETLIHELAHNMGSQHDRESAKNGDGALDADDYGAFTYSFGLKTAASAGNFYTIMAYGDSGQTDYRVFSNPRITFCGGLACGTTTYEDNARSLGSIAPIISTFRANRISSVRNDVNGDALSDLLWANGGARQFGYWLMNGAATAGARTFSGLTAGYVVSATGDYNGDGRFDLLWNHPSLRRLYIWFATESGGYSSQYVSDYPEGWSVAGSGDVNGDGFADIFWENASARQFAYWLMSGAGRSSARTFSGLTAGYRFAISGDFNGDRRADVVWFNAASRQLYVWSATTTGSYSSAYAGTYPAGWRIVGSGDVDGNKRDDLLWQNTGAGQFAYWLMNGAARTGSRTFSGISAGYEASSSGDFNGDGRSDVVWTNPTTRSVYIWFATSQGTYISNYVATYPVGWLLVR